MQALHFNIRIIRAGERYGLDDCLVHDGPAMIEFYDARFPHTPHGQFVSRYYVSTIRGHKGGLCLDGGIPEWSVSAEQMAGVQIVLDARAKAGLL